ncbi:MAG TPA: DUF1073 domain-containing protein [Acidimicrobiales bacterium]|nr:DUF1073 domain-containing protein [Acidimicrobiales bacterium]
MGKKNSHHRVQQRITDRAATIRAETADSFVNLSARLGFGAGSPMDGARYATDFISRNPQNLEAAYRSNWLCGMAVDLVAEDMTREGVTFVSEDLDTDDAATLHSAVERLAIWPALCELAKWGRLYGGAIGVLLVDGQQLSTPLRPDTVSEGQFKGLAVLDRHQVTPSLENTVTELGPDLGKPVFYTVAPGSACLSNQRIHYSRVVRVDGLELPWRQRLAENGWGQSILERLWDRVVSFDSTTMGAAQLVYRAHLRTLKIKGLREIVATGGAVLQGLINQIAFMRSTQNNEGVTILDGEDDFATHSYTFSGLDDVLAQLGQQIAGAIQIPLVRLFGQSPAGMSATGESDLRTYYDNVKKEQDRKLRPGLNKIFDLLHRSELGGELPEGFGFEFVPLWQMTPTERADVAKTVTEAVVAAHDAGIIKASTAAKELQHGARETGVYSHIEQDEIDELDLEPPEPPAPEVDPLAVAKPEAVA